jgi:hypothetical protein
MRTKHKQSTIKFLAVFIFLSLLLFQCSSSKKTVNESAPLHAADIKSMVDNQQFIFVAERVNPLRGRSRILTSEYDVSVKKDSLVSYLPYFGRAYQAPINPAEGGIQFTSTRYSYDVSPNRKNGWDVNIKPGDYQDVQQLSFSIFDNGSATLNVTSTYKDPISFGGYVKKIKSK